MIKTIKTLRYQLFKDINQIKKAKLISPDYQKVLDITKLVQDLSNYNYDRFETFDVLIGNSQNINILGAFIINSVDKNTLH